ncbi:MAG: dihydrofolate reductase [Ectothiorhodospiraceae bacterium]|jgi:dihydrofolate reductase
MSATPTVSLIAAMAEDRVIGRDGTLPWRLPADMRHFVRLTRGKPVIMGRRNYADIGRPLPGRHNIVLTRSDTFQAPGCTLVHDADGALAAAGSDVPEVMVIGGEEIYRLFLPRADRLYLTFVQARVPGQTRFPEVAWQEWQEAERCHRDADAENSFAMEFVEYRRRGG